MNPSHKLYWLIGGVVALLVVASLIGRILRARATDSNAAVIDNLNARVRAWWSMVAIFAAAFLLGKDATIAMFAFISFFALREFLTLTEVTVAPLEGGPIELHEYLTLARRHIVFAVGGSETPGG